ncbi:MAG: 3-hydroxyisobutyrate dehydrogenase, partial [Rhodoferax sp.]|nr:3-hydroxyisobutyrate dehydrogenase [Rhodoferax sp.]
MGKLKIGYVGIGLMGLPMTRRLLELGYQVTVFDIASARTDAACAAGAKLAATPAQVVR